MNTVAYRNTPEYKKKQADYQRARRAKGLQANVSREKQAEISKRWRLNNPEKARAAVDRWNARNLEKVRVYSRNRRFLRDYGITIEQRDQLVLKQDSKCAICCETFGSGMRDVHVDHCHATGKIRAMLCNHCNNVLGRARDNPLILRQAAAYLERRLPL